ncbi:LLM class flavin-dependent oxidoreductase [Gordonia sp. CPCC 205333]|uniref:LLM class flavin-dependent oxidoreductase n=1 Tax=Gordonia sp. CPCC 205333 TaxID=3140790 RepID=UPI003AF3D199
MTELGILDLVPIRAGGTAREALENAADLARSAEQSGYRRYWLAEHHFASLASSAPAVVAAHVLSATSTIRVGAGAVQLSQRVAARVAEEWGTLATLHPGRVDLGLGRSSGRADQYREALTRTPTPAVVPVADHPVVDGVVLPKPRDLRELVDSARIKTGLAVITPPGDVPDYATQVREILALLAGRFTPEGLDSPLHLTPGEGSDLLPWILGNSPGASAQLAGRLGLPFVANYHLAPGHTVQTVAAYREAFEPGVLDTPYLVVSADVLAAESSGDAHRLARSFLPWLDSVSRGVGAIEIPDADDVAASEVERLTARHSARVATRFVGDPDDVVGRLAALAALTEADELILTTLTHRHDDRVRSHRLIADAWRDRTPKAEKIR